MKAKIRRGQIFSADALIALALVIMITSIILNTSGAIQGEISNLLGWYSRSNIANNMLDVMTKTPGEPVNWTSNLSNVRVIGLRSTNVPYSLSYRKVLALMYALNSSVAGRIIGVLENMSSNKNFQMEFYVSHPVIELNVTYPPLVVEYMNVTYPYNLTSPLFTITVINGSMVSNSTVVEASKNVTPWIEYASREVVVSIKVYNSTQLLPGRYTGLRVILSGSLIQNVPPGGLLKFALPSNETGYAILAVVDGGTRRIIVISKAYSNVSLQCKVYTLNTNSSMIYTGNTTAVEVPWSSIFSEFNPEVEYKNVQMWLYKDTFPDGVIMQDEGSIGILLQPTSSRGEIKLWVWEP